MHERRRGQKGQLQERRSGKSKSSMQIGYEVNRKKNIKFLASGHLKKDRGNRGKGESFFGGKKRSDI